ncbi:MAG TPA: OmpA family protein [Pyrinomonadaceae bacterium]|nr:OmpA family protein [Pyrinomonadaceae bacterium]
MMPSEAPELLDDAPPATSSNDEENMAELRSLLLGPAEQQLAEVHTRLTDPRRQMEEVSRVLPAAISVRSRQDQDLTNALAPTVAAALQQSVRKDPQPLADAIFPIMGPAIRKAIATALSGMVQSLNQSMSYSLSAQGLKWRLEGLRTGKSFAEVVMLKTLIYRVEQVFLIHKDTGLLLQQVSAPGTKSQDADMVSGMLTAIQDFVHDSFTTPEGDELEDMRVGDLAVWIERGPQAVLAAVIRGNAPEDLRTVLQETLEKIHLQFGTALSEFQGDAAPFAATVPLLEDCLAAHYDSGSQAKTAKRRITPLTVILGVLLLAALVWGFFWLRDMRRWDAYVERLRSEPGIVVAEIGKRNGKRYLSGLRDPLARDPQQVMHEFKVNPEGVISHWEPFHALAPEFVMARTSRLLNPPESVRLKLNNGALEAEGYASHDWVSETRRAARFLPGVAGFSDEKLLDLNRIEAPQLRFQLDRADLVPGQQEALDLLTKDIERLQSLAVALQKNVRLEISGHTDTSGSEARNSTLAEERARTIASALQARLPAYPNLTIKAVGSREKLREEVTETDRASNRSVTFKVVTSEAAK